jgi:excisionase family DNA binding protein
VSKLYTPNQVAALLQVSVPTIKRWLISGELPGIKMGPAGHWRIRSDVLQDYLLKHEKQTTQITQNRGVEDVQ